MGGVQHCLVQGHPHQSRKPAQIVLHVLLCTLIGLLCFLGILLSRLILPSRPVLDSRRILPNIPLTVCAKLTHMNSKKRTVVTSETLRRRLGPHQAVAPGRLYSAQLWATAAMAVAQGLLPKVAE